MSRDPSSIEIVQSVIRNQPSALQEDPDVAEKISYRTIPASMVTEEQWNVCAATFSTHYGVWSQRAEWEMGPWARPGKNIAMSPTRLKAQSLPNGVNNILITAVTEAGLQVGHCFISQWMHGGDRVWWITQLVVQPEYRNQRKATRMLRALALHYDIGKNPHHRDFVGVLSSHPLTICAVLRVFGHGIESLPSRSDWELQRGPSKDIHTPLQHMECNLLMQESPVDYVRTARIHPVSLSAYTNFFIDHTVPDQALQAIHYAMNKQLREQWQWPFGDLAEGHEYLCILEYRFDPEYAIQPRLAGKVAIESAPSSYSASAARDGLRNSVHYAQLNKFLIQEMGSGNADPRFTQRISGSAYGSMAKRVLRANDVLNDFSRLVTDTMDGKRVPSDIRPFYSSVIWNGNRFDKHPLPDFILTWLELKDWVEKIFGDDMSVHLRLLLLQAVHFEDLFDECEKLRKKDEKEEKRMAHIEKRRQGRDAGKTNEILPKRHSMPLNAVHGVMSRKPAEETGCLPLPGISLLPRASTPISRPS